MDTNYNWPDGVCNVYDTLMLIAIDYLDFRDFFVNMLFAVFDKERFMTVYAVFII